MIAKKVCMVGAFAVGKTSLVRQFVESIYSDKYQTTIGVKIAKKKINLPEQDVQLMIWDIEGVDIFTELKASYLRGASGILLVVDGTRPKSYDNINSLLTTIKREIGDVPIVLLANKVDLKQDWKLDDQWLQEVSGHSIEAMVTSAKTGENVNAAFEQLTHRMLCTVQNSEAS